MTPLLPRPIHPDDRLTDFDCGVDVLNAWLAHRALRNEKSGDSRTYVSTDAATGAILGYYSLSGWTVSHQDVGGGWMRRNAPDPISVILLGRLAVATSAAGSGLGRDLLSDALATATRAARLIGARALVAEALNESAGTFYAHQGLWQSNARPNLYCAKLLP